MNPYQNHSKKLVEKEVRNIQQFINENIKDTKLNITLSEIIEFSRYQAFNEGKEQGKYEASQKLKELINVDEPYFSNSNWQSSSD